MDNIEGYLRERDIKVTKPRTCILKIFLRSDGVMSAEDVLTRCRLENLNINMSTIYRTLELFYDKNIIKRFDLDKNKSGYAIIKRNHKHVLQCKLCHREIEIDCPMQQIEDMVKNKTGFLLTDESLDFKLYGICRQCRSKLLKNK
ncbi:MAG: transcriptional repressor [Clostridium sp.]|uniref:Fur family transcriptional regulator n=1 Tax=Clostridium sp. TaxID=1506 RepID=UPI0025BA1AD4|nr:Fur family transcriptional regulator [Clostridium sp.]MCH3965012.1 transcriptional repressor [Clostridium sp.]MCI1714233.1 transcriptional repressor [Clostridium sp.]MCI1798495.1 transcriptional repressor [Clostridium sp.]MCI1812774.1 transcriptional repressor [Clostridium sp.]MCI1869304.1 transcriptional repressor [Clostridium sp.]